MRFKVVGGFLDLEPSGNALQDISLKLRKIAKTEEKKEKEGAAFKDVVKEPTVKSLESLKRPGIASKIIGGD